MELINELEEGRKAAENIEQFLGYLKLAEKVLTRARDAVSTLATLQEQIRVQEGYYAEVVSKREQEYAIIQELFLEQEGLVEAIEAERGRRLEAMRIELEAELGQLRLDKE